jgi:hypothetical protein
MATKKNAETNVPEELEKVQQDLKSEALDKDAEIAKLRAQLAAAQRQNEGYRKGKDAEIVEQASKDAIARGVDPWTVMVSVRVPERRDTTEKSYWLCVNGRSVQLPANNQYQEMKLPFAEALMNTLQADRFAQKFADTQIQVYDPITNPHKEQ